MSATAPHPDAAKQASASLLLVDDEGGILAALRRVFRSSDYRVLTASGGQEGLEILARERIDLVISDMRMPAMSGEEFLEQVAERWPDIVRIVLTGHSDIDTTVAAINRGQIYKYVSKPWHDGELRLTVQRALERRHLELERLALLETIQRQNAELTGLNTNLERKVGERVRAIEQMKTMLEKSNRELKKNLVDTVGVLSSIIEARDGSVTGHSRRVAELAHRVAAGMGMKESETQAVLFAALLHDIGRVALPDALVGRPFGALTHAEHAEVDRHPIVGQALLMSLTSMREVTVLIRSHREHYDGSGSPDGLVGPAIPLGARIIAPASDYELLRSGRLLLEQLSDAEARQYLADHRGSRYDPEIVDRLLGILREKPSRAEREVLLEPAQLRPGMRLARDLLTRKGMILLPRGHVFDERLIAQIRELARSAGGSIRICIAQE